MTSKTIQSNANGAVKSKTAKATKTGNTAPKSERKLPETLKVSQAQIVQQRLDKRVKLNALYKDYDQLQEALRDFDSIQTYSDIRVAVYCGSQVQFNTSRHDAVQSALKSLEENIKEKLNQVQDDLAKFEF